MPNDGVNRENYAHPVKCKKSVAELKYMFYTADKANRQKYDTLAKYLQQCKKSEKIYGNP